MYLTHTYNVLYTISVSVPVLPVPPDPLCCSVVPIFFEGPLLLYFLGLLNRKEIMKSHRNRSELRARDRCRYTFLISVYNTEES